MLFSLVTVVRSHTDVMVATHIMVVNPIMAIMSLTTMGKCWLWFCQKPAATSDVTTTVVCPYYHVDYVMKP
jgi:hypothetical protein